jgi:hypothetical protein
VYPEPSRSVQHGNHFELHEEHWRGRALEWSHAVGRELVTGTAPSRPSAAVGDSQDWGPNGKHRAQQPGDLDSR